MGVCFIPPTTNFTRAFILHSISSTYIGIPLFIIGAVSNIICMLLWKRLMKRARHRNISCGIYLMTISVVDTGMLLSFFLCDTLFYLYPKITENHVYNIFYAYLGYPAFQFFTFLSFWLIAGVDTCRLTMVLFPMKLRQSATRITNSAIVLIITFVFGVNIPNFLAYQASFTLDGVPCRWQTPLLSTESFHNYIFWFQCVFLTSFPWLIIVIVNLIMIIREAIVPNYTPKSQRRAGEMGNLLFGISSWFVTVIFWQCVAQCFYLKTSKDSESWSSTDSSFAFAKLGMVMNSSTKLFLYLLTSKTFRKALFHLFVNPETIYTHLTRRPIVTKHPEKQDKYASQIRRTSRRVFGKSINAVMGLPDDVIFKYTAPPIPTSNQKETIEKIFAAKDVTKLNIDADFELTSTI